MPPSLPATAPRASGRARGAVLPTVLAAMLLAGCGGGGAESEPDPSSDPTTENPSSVESDEPDASPDADAAEGDLPDADGTWSTTYGTMTFTVDGTDFEGSYDSEDGTLAGTVGAAGTTGEWYEPSSSQACDEERGGTLYWGTFTFVFNEEPDAFEGTWGYCGEEETSSWDGELLDGGDAAQPATTPLIDPEVVAAADVYVALTPEQVVALAPEAPRVRGEATLTFEGDLVDIVVATELAPGDVAIGACLCLGESGVDGPSFYDLGAFAPGSPEGQAVWTAQVELPEVAEAFRSGDLGRFYVEAVTREGPSGLVRGQLDVEPGPGSAGS